MRNIWGKKLLSALIATLMILAVVPFAAFAEDGDATASTTSSPESSAVDLTIDSPTDSLSNSVITSAAATEVSENDDETTVIDSVDALEEHDDILVTAQDIEFEEFASVYVEHPVTVELSSGGTAAANVSDAKAGDIVTLTAAPITDYLFQEWLVISPEGLVIDGDSFVMPDEPVTVKAVFKYRTLEELLISSSKTTYIEGETLDIASLSAILRYDTGNETIFTDFFTGYAASFIINCSITPSRDTPLTADITQITFSYTDYGIVRTATLPITVLPDDGTTRAVYIEMRDTYGDAWFGSGSMSRLRLSGAGTFPQREFTCYNSSYDKAFVRIPIGETVSLHWLGVAWSYECRFTLRYDNADGDVIYTQSTGLADNGLTPVFLYSFIVEGDLPVYYPVTVESGIGGTASPSVNNVKAGDIVTLTAIPDIHYHLKEWQIVSPAGLVIENDSFIMPDAAVTVSAVFEQDVPVLQSIVLTLPTKLIYNEGETLDLSGMSVVAKYNYGPDKTINDWTATPASGIALTVANETVIISYMEGDVTTNESFDITVNKKSSEIKKVANPAAVSTFIGTAPILPNTVLAEFEDGRKNVPVEVVWESIAPSSYAKKGSFTVNGSVEGWSGKVSIKVTVAIPSITKVYPLDDVKTYVLNNAKLPKTVYVDYEDGRTMVEVSVKWESPRIIDYLYSHTYTLNGKVDGTSTKVMIKVVVQELKIIGYTFSDVSTKVGKAPMLPSLITANWNSGDTTRVLVDWNKVDKKLYQSPGSFTINGKVIGTGTKVSITVTVK